MQMHVIAIKILITISYILLRNLVVIEFKFNTVIKNNFPYIHVIHRNAQQMLFPRFVKSHFSRELERASRDRE